MRFENKTKYLNFAPKESKCNVMAKRSAAAETARVIKDTSSSFEMEKEEKYLQWISGVRRIHALHRES